MEQLTLIIGNKNYSSWSLRPWIFMRYFKLPFNETRVALFEEGTDAQLRPYFSNLKVPVLLDGDEIIWDSLAILEYLSETCLDGKGWPVDKKARAMARSISAEMHSSFTALRNALPMNCRKHFPDYPVMAEVQEDIDRICDLWTTCRNRFGNSGPWLFGEFSIADAMYAPIVLRFNGYDVKTDELVADYMEASLSLPDMQDWIEAGRQESEIIAMDEV